MTRFGQMPVADTSFKIEGLDPILKKMKGLSQQMQKKGARSAATKAMRIVRDAARNGAKEWDDPATNVKPIWKRIVTRNDAKGGKRVGGVVVKVGVEGGARVNKDADNAGHFRYQEFGTATQRARPALRPALANNVEKVTASLVSNLNIEIDKAISKL